MTERSGLGLLEVAVLEAIDAVAGADGFVQSLRVLERLEGEGFGRTYLYEVMQDLVAPWQVHLPMIGVKATSAPRATTLRRIRSTPRSRSPRLEGWRLLPSVGRSAAYRSG